MASENQDKDNKNYAVIKPEGYEGTKLDQERDAKKQAQANSAEPENPDASVEKALSEEFKKRLKAVLMNRFKLDDDESEKTINKVSPAVLKAMEEKLEEKENGYESLLNNNYQAFQSAVNEVRSGNDKKSYIDYTSSSVPLAPIALSNLKSSNDNGFGPKANDPKPNDSKPSSSKVDLGGEDPDFDKKFFEDTPPSFDENSSTAKEKSNKERPLLTTVAMMGLGLTVGAAFGPLAAMAAVTSINLYKTYNKMSKKLDAEFEAGNLDKKPSVLKKLQSTMTSRAGLIAIAGSMLGAYAMVPGMDGAVNSLFSGGAEIMSNSGGLGAAFTNAATAFTTNIASVLNLSEDTPRKVFNLGVALSATVAAVSAVNSVNNDLTSKQKRTMVLVAGAGLVASAGALVASTFGFSSPDDDFTNGLKDRVLDVFGIKEADAALPTDPDVDTDLTSADPDADATVETDNSWSSEYQADHVDLSEHIGEHETPYGTITVTETGQVLTDIDNPNDLFRAMNHAEMPQDTVGTLANGNEVVFVTGDQMHAEGYDNLKDYNEAKGITGSNAAWTDPEPDTTVPTDDVTKNDMNGVVEPLNLDKQLDQIKYDYTNQMVDASGVAYDVGHVLTDLGVQIDDQTLMDARSDISNFVQNDLSGEINALIEVGTIHPDQASDVADQLVKNKFEEVINGLRADGHAAEAYAMEQAYEDFTGQPYSPDTQITLSPDAMSAAQDAYNVNVAEYGILIDAYGAAMQDHFGADFDLNDFHQKFDDMMPQMNEILTRTAELVNAGDLQPEDAPDFMHAQMSQVLQDRAALDTSLEGQALASVARDFGNWDPSEAVVGNDATTPEEEAKGRKYKEYLRQPVFRI